MEIGTDRSTDRLDAATVMMMMMMMMMIGPAGGRISTDDL
jgi:hypothetical protein